MKKKRLHIDCLIAVAFIFLFFFVRQCFAIDQENPIIPEPASLALVSSTGLLGFLIRFARRRFAEFKRIFDIVVSVTGLVLTAPFLVFTAVLIKIVSSGPVFFRQQRVGQGGEAFQMYKLRTMKINAEKDTGPVWAKENDSRLIMFGRIIRKAHIDELPQLFNVLKGQMSIIGPRPERPVFVKKLKQDIPDYLKRLKVKPGITGLAQVWHKYDETIEDVKKKIKLDLLYIRKMCLWVDMRILALTVVAVLTGKGAR
jgi:exopolysaccharide biosynthesis polyprenyl glycosylphosphotransferase